MRQLVTIRTIDGLEPIAGADAIEVALIDGWKVVTKKGEFQVGDRCVYFEIDSFLPESDQRYAFLMKSSVREFEGVRGHKLRTIKLRGQISQGLVLPLSSFPELSEWHEDTAAHLGIKKWEPVLSAQIAGQCKGSFPSFIRKTDQERCQNLKGDIFGYEDQMFPFNVPDISDKSRQELIEKGLLVQVDGEWKKVVKAKADRHARYEITIKLDGSSCTLYHNEGQVGVCSRNLELKMEGNEGNALVQMMTPELREKLTTLGRNIALQGEIMGPGIQGNRENLKTATLFIFDIYDIDNGEYLGADERYDLAHFLGVQHAPIIGMASKLDDLGIHDIDGLLAYAEGYSLNHPVREGLVFKRVDGKFSFKAISNAFLAKEKD